ncbi:MAG TPA: class I SAM-dependent methyltransferase [Pyrinomonadaceae bacterium]|nr:class I SAM-dependent methyltransferase [Pyrinomonadaceae bacterium]
MPTYRINPYIGFIENRLFPGEIQRAVFHRLTGEIIEYDFTRPLTADEVQLQQLIQRGFLITEDYDPLAPLLDWYVARPIQNPALMYRSKTGDWMLVRTTMKQTVYSPKRDELPVVIEEQLSPLAAEMLLMADGTKTFREIFGGSREEREALEFLTIQERQLIKLTPRREDIDDPFSNVNIVPRNLYHSDRKDQPTITDFHLRDIEEANWEFDFIEPTVNHSFRFPHEVFGGLDYGSRFCLSTLRPEVVPLLNESDHLEVLEVGGGTGSFARSFIKQANEIHLDYHILDLSPALMKNQRKLLSELLPESSHFHQDATEFDLPGKTFDLIVSNEVIADFPVASVEGDGAYYVEKYDLSNKDAPDSFVVNAGVFRFIEQAWKHLKPGGTLIVSEYGAEDRYPAASFNLNHDEYTIHFGHVAACAAKVGFQCRLLTLKEFLDLDDEVLVLNGREEHLLCLNHVLKNYGQALPYAVISKADFEKQAGGIVEQTGLIGYSFSPLRTGYHYGPNIRDFLVLIMNKSK